MLKGCLYERITPMKFGKQIGSCTQGKTTHPAYASTFAFAFFS